MPVPVPWAIRADWGDLRFAARCGAAMAVLPGDVLIIATGEIKPGLRTPTCVRTTMKHPR